jgi:hypothetical protein
MFEGLQIDRQTISHPLRKAQQSPGKVQLSDPTNPRSGSASQIHPDANAHTPSLRHLRQAVCDRGPRQHKGYRHWPFGVLATFPRVGRANTMAPMPRCRAAPRGPRRTSTDKGLHARRRRLGWEAQDDMQLLVRATCSVARPALLSSLCTHPHVPDVPQIHPVPIRARSRGLFSGHGRFLDGIGSLPLSHAVNCRSSSRMHFPYTNTPFISYIVYSEETKLSLGSFNVFLFISMAFHSKGRCRRSMHTAPSCNSSHNGPGV